MSERLMIRRVGRRPEGCEEPGAGEDAPPAGSDKFRDLADLRRRLPGGDEVFDGIPNAAAGMDAVKRGAQGSDGFAPHFRSATADGVVSFEAAIAQRREREHVAGDDLASSDDGEASDP